MNNARLQADFHAIPELEKALLSVPVDASAPVFNAPWEAQAFAMTLCLHERGVFTWEEWATALSQAIRDAQTDGDPDSGTTYYHHWLTALERITIAKKLVSDALITHRKDLWKQAARLTPHGKPIELITVSSLI